MSRPLPHDGDQLPTELGRKIEPPEPPKPGHTSTETPGVYKGPDGKLVTAIPENERARLAQPHSFCSQVTRNEFEAIAARIYNDAFNYATCPAKSTHDALEVDYSAIELHYAAMMSAHEQQTVERFYRGEFNLEGTRTGRLPADRPAESGKPQVDLTETALDSKPFKRCLAVGQSVDIEQVEDGLIYCEPTDVYETDPVAGIVTRVA